MGIPMVVPLHHPTGYLDKANAFLKSSRYPSEYKLDRTRNTHDPERNRERLENGAAKL